LNKQSRRATARVKQATWQTKMSSGNKLKEEKANNKISKMRIKLNKNKIRD
jgi:hypothetical protein